MLSLVAIGCNSKKKTYKTVTSASDDAEFNDDNDDNDDDDDDDDDATDTDSLVKAYGSGYSDCDITASENIKTNDNVAKISICRDKYAEVKFIVRFYETDSSDQLCFFPTYHDDTGKSFYIGPPIPAHMKEGQISQGYFQKSRSGNTGYPYYRNFSTFPINGIMAMKCDDIYDYYLCMHSLVSTNLQDVSIKEYWQEQYCEPFVEAKKYISISYR